MSRNGIRIPPEHVEAIKAARELREALTSNMHKLPYRSVSRGAYKVLIENIDELGLFVTGEPDYFVRKMHSSADLGMPLLKDRK
ncbi:hypothetical protein [Methylobacterium nodulans]|uniref:Uncharacterized protein n=1 Tax=Methylobacterium nodulans (strain LMG 21967 / CNCM I-2342 / ORS 2060) TaxID=460265 RepID=B8INM2_METNO|nr:hypothetical protein [Methylobacterium nodulans]ACL58388.1 conserved hypothetical protein [Methylobacterium nodulans ORS 2060]